MAASLLAAFLTAAPLAAAQTDGARGKADKEAKDTAPALPVTPVPATDTTPNGGGAQAKAEKAPAAAPAPAKKAPAAAPAPSASKPAPSRPASRGRATTTRSGRSRAPATPVRARSRGSGVPSIAEERSSGHAADASATGVPASKPRRRKDAPALPLDQPPAPEPESGFVLASAAEDVVEVIPGTLLLALVGMIALTITLCFRSYLIERRRGGELHASYEGTAHALATAVEAKDEQTGNHIGRVRDLGLLLAREVSPRDARDPQLAYGFLLHDIGKLAVPDAVLCKPGRLDDHEWELMRQHCEEGVRILSGVPFLDRAVDVVRHHHERWDGGGYPAGLRGEEIPLWARMFAVVDTLDAITSTRPYRPRQSFEAALEEIRRCSGTQFDPRVVEALERLDQDQVEALLEPAQEAAQASKAEPVALRPPTAALPAA